MNGEQSLTFTIRPARSIDRQIIRTVSRNAWESAYHSIYTPGEIEGLFNGELAQHGSWINRRQTQTQSEQQTLVAQSGGQIIGYIAYALLQSGDGEITQLYVDPAYQGRSVGKALWDAAVNTLGEQGSDRAWVWVLARADAYQFYLRQGCTPVEIGHYRVGDHIETALGCTVTIGTSEPQIARFSPWLRSQIIDGHFPWGRAQSATMQRFLSRYTLHESHWLGLWLSTAGDYILVIDWDLTWANWKTERVAVPVEGRAFLVLRFSKLYQFISSDIEADLAAIQYVESGPVSEIERRVWLQLITTQTMIGGESAGYILDETLHHTSIVSPDGDNTHLFHAAGVRFLCLSQVGEIIAIPGLAEEK